MANLIKADLFKIFKSKLFLVTLIICGAFPIFIVGVYAFIGGDFAEILGTGMFTTMSIASSSFSLSNNVGLVIPIFATLFIGQDLSSGVIRNKIVVGSSRTKIYFSHLISCSIYSLCCMLLYTGLTIALSSIFFPFGLAEIEQAGLLVVEWLILGILTYIFITSLSTSVILSTQNTALSIVITVVAGIALTLATSLLSLFSLNDTIRYISYCIPTYALSNLSSNLLMAAGSSLDLEVFLFGLGSYIFFIAFNTILGVIAFNKKDIK